MPKTISMTKAEIDSLKQFCDNNLAVGKVEITYTEGSIGPCIHVQVKDLPETRTDITDYNSW